MALQRMSSDAPDEAASLLRERVADFPTSRATATDVHALLKALAVFADIDPQLAREAVRKIFEVIDRPDFRHVDVEYETTATYTIRKKQIKTKTTYATALLPSAGYLAVFDPEAYRARELSLPEWRTNLSDLTPSDLPRIVKATFVQRSHQPQTTNRAADPLPDISKMTYEDAIAAVHNLEFPNRYRALFRVAARHLEPVRFHATALCGSFEQQDRRPVCRVRCSVDRNVGDCGQIG